MSIEMSTNEKIRDIYPAQAPEPDLLSILELPNEPDHVQDDEQGTMKEPEQVGVASDEQRILLEVQDMLDASDFMKQDHISKEVEFMVKEWLVPTLKLLAKHHVEKDGTGEEIVKPLVWDNLFDTIYLYFFPVNEEVMTREYLSILKKFHRNIEKYRITLGDELVKTTKKTQVRMWRAFLREHDQIPDKPEGRLWVDVALTEKMTELQMETIAYLRMIDGKRKDAVYQNLKEGTRVLQIRCTPMILSPLCLCSQLCLHTR
ncbi:hypothetical protein K491DRAFT_690746 [Lophiostoma macrostomum CBS 122681]|uniref:Uncharacterized protein n=1 Tax=Lophiostoma macrostomum CBS 122681 TaxID=1314788 RepID=A0A6A6TDF0_9PLEO|nr:hypothetical protein K491DRAFT_690746 [Lophiostoma macrostomum CBS 122681]